MYQLFWINHSIPELRKVSLLLNITCMLRPLHSYQWVIVYRRGRDLFQLKEVLSIALKIVTAAFGELRALISSYLSTNLHLCILVPVSCFHKLQPKFLHSVAINILFRLSSFF